MDFNFLRKLGEKDLDSPSQVFDESKTWEGEDLTATLTTKTFSLEELSLFKYARFLVYVLVFLLPLFFLPFTSELLEFNKQFLVFAFSGVGLILYLGQVIRTGHLILKRTPLNFAVLIFLGVVLLVSLFSDLRYQSIFGGFGAGFQESLVSSISFAVLFFLILNTFGITRDSAKSEATKLLNIFGSSLFLALILGTLQIFGVPIFKLFQITQQTFNTIGTINSLGVISGVLLILSLSKLGPEEDWGLFGYIRIPAIVLSLFLLAILNWWILWLAAISGLVLVLALGSLTDWRLLNYFWPLAIIILAVVFILLNFNLAAILGLNLPLEIAPSFTASFEIAKDVLLKSPFFGVGPENFSLAYDFYKPSAINNTIFWNIRFSEATSELFNVIISYGILGLAAFGFLIWTGFKLGLKNLKLLAVFTVLVASWILYPYNETLGFSFWFLLGLLALSASKKDDELIVNLEKSPKHSLITSISFVGVLVLAIIGFYFVSLRYVANIKFVRALSTTNIDDQAQLLVDALNLNRNEDLYSRSLANLLIARANQELLGLSKAKTVEERQLIISRVQNFSATAINLSGEITQRHKNDPANWFSRALIYENLINIVDGSDQWAIRIYQEYSKFSPKDPIPYLRTGNILLARADFVGQLISGQSAAGLSQENRTNFQNQIVSSLKSAEESYQKAIELKPNYVLAIYNLGVVYEREGRVKDAIRQLEMTKSATPLDANIALQLGLLYYRDNQKEKSFNEIQRAVTIFSDFSNARWYLALLYEERGNLDRALEELFRIRTLNPDNKILKNKIQELEAGKRSIPPERVTGVRPLDESR